MTCRVCSLQNFFFLKNKRGKKKPYAPLFVPLHKLPQIECCRWKKKKGEKLLFDYKDYFFLSGENMERSSDDFGRITMCVGKVGDFFCWVGTESINFLFFFLFWCLSALEGQQLLHEDYTNIGLNYGLWRMISERIPKIFDWGYTLIINPHEENFVTFSYEVTLQKYFVVK